MSSKIHYGGNGYAECGERDIETTEDASRVTCPTCRGWLPMVAPDYRNAIGALEGLPLRMSPEDAIRKTRDAEAARDAARAEVERLRAVIKMFAEGTAESSGRCIDCAAVHSVAVAELAKANESCRGV